MIIPYFPKKERSLSSKEKPNIAERYLFMCFYHVSKKFLSIQLILTKVNYIHFFKFQGSDIFKSRVLVFPQTVTCSFVRNNQINRCMSTAAQPDTDLEGEDVPSAPAIDTPPQIKFKRLDKTAKQIMTVSSNFLVNTLFSCITLN